MTQTRQASALDVEGLVAQADALLALDADNKLVPHGIGGLARDLIGRLASALEAAEANLVAANKQMRGALEEQDDEYAYQEGFEDGRSEARGAAVELWDMVQRWAIERRFIDKPGHDGITAQELMDAVLVAFGERKPPRTALPHEAHND